jgi:formylglycine-generating enzyme required for sulfatase activity
MNKHYVLATACLCQLLALGQTGGLSGSMAHMSGQTFVMGTNPGNIERLMARFGTKRRELFITEIPAHEVSLREFSIDRTEVTNAAFRVFVETHPEWTRERLQRDRHNGEYLRHWINGSYPADEAETPATFITWDAAAAYCSSVGKRLPTEAEWEFAAGGGQSWEFPWGDEMPDATRANWSGTGIGKATRVASFPPTGSGVHDLAGNVWEFVQDAWSDSYNAPSPSPGRRVIRGGSYGAAAINLRVRYRDSHSEIGAGPHVGFRCAQSN